jgi:hypothetical protein
MNPEIEIDGESFEIPQKVWDLLLSLSREKGALQNELDSIKHRATDSAQDLSGDNLE